MRKNNNYSPTKVKARNFLTKVSYNRIKNNDFENRSFIIDCYSFILLYLNLFYSERKFESILDREYVNAMWCLQIPNGFYNFISQPEHFETLNKLKLKFQDANEIVKSFTDDETQFQLLKEFFIKNAPFYQFVFGNSFPRCFARIDDYGIKNKTAFDNQYKIYLSQKNIFNWQQNATFQTAVKDENEKEEISTLLNLCEIDEPDINFLVETKTDGTASDVIKKKKKKRELSKKQLQKRKEKKQKLEEQFIENEKKMEQIRIKIKIKKKNL